jgi:hypothetical protein
MPVCAVERHAVAFLSDFHFPTEPDAQGVISDNDERICARMIEKSDRASKEAARKVFDTLFPFAVSVRIKDAWQVTICPSGA